MNKRRKILTAVTLGIFILIVLTIGLNQDFISSRYSYAPLQVYWSFKGNGHFTPFGSALGILSVIYAALFALLDVPVKLESRSESKSKQPPLQPPVQPTERSSAEPPAPEFKVQLFNEDPLTWNIGGPEGRQKVEAELNEIFWSLPREMALDEALRGIATKVMLGREHGARMAAIDILTRLELRSREQTRLITAGFKLLPNGAHTITNADGYEVLPGGDPELDFLIPPDEALYLHMTDLEFEAIQQAKRLRRNSPSVLARHGLNLDGTKIKHEERR